MLGVFTPPVVRLAEYLYGHACARRKLVLGDDVAAAGYKAMQLQVRKLLLESYQSDGLHRLDALRRLSRIREHVKQHHAAGWGVRAWLEIPDREGVRIIVRDQHDRILMQHRTNDAPTNPGKWTAPGGRIEPGEDPHTAACRELIEETGLPAETLTPLGDLYFTAPHDGGWVRHHLFTTVTTATEHDLRLGEGQALRFVEWTEAAWLDVSPSARNALAIAWLTAPVQPTSEEHQ